MRIWTFWHLTNSNHRFAAINKSEWVDFWNGFCLLASKRIALEIDRYTYTAFQFDKIVSILQIHYKKFSIVWVLVFVLLYIWLAKTIVRSIDRHHLVWFVDHLKTFEQKFPYRRQWISLKCKIVCAWYKEENTYIFVQIVINS